MSFDCPIVPFLFLSIILPSIVRKYVEIKCQLDATDDFLLQILLLAQHVSGTTMPIIRSSRVLYRCFGFQVVGMV